MSAVSAAEQAEFEFALAGQPDANSEAPAMQVVASLRQAIEFVPIPTPGTRLAPFFREGFQLGSAEEDVFYGDEELTPEHLDTTGDSEAAETLEAVNDADVPDEAVKRVPPQNGSIRALPLSLLGMTPEVEPATPALPSDSYKVDLALEPLVEEEFQPSAPKAVPGLPPTAFSVEEEHVSSTGHVLVPPAIDPSAEDESQEWAAPVDLDDSPSQVSEENLSLTRSSNTPEGLTQGSATPDGVPPSIGGFADLPETGGDVLEQPDSSQARITELEVGLDRPADSNVQVAVNTSLHPGTDSGPSTLVSGNPDHFGQTTIGRTEADQVETESVEAHDVKAPSRRPVTILLAVALATLVLVVAVCALLFITRDDTPSNASKEPESVSTPAYVSPSAFPTVPAVIQAENYDEGGPGVSYADSDDTNSGNVYRSDGVDIMNIPDQPNKLAVVDSVEGEWVRYTVTVKKDAEFVVSVGVASLTSAPGSLSVSVNGKRLGTFYGTPTSDGFDFKAQRMGQVALSAGEHRIQVDWSGDGGLALDWLEVARP